MGNYDLTQKYFFNNTYDSKIVDKKRKEYNNQQYIRCMDVQRHLCNIHRIDGGMGTFAINREINYRYNVGYDSWSTDISTSSIHYFIHKDFTDIKKKAYTVDEMSRYNGIFTHKVLFFINGRFLSNVYIIPDLYRTILVIKDSNTFPDEGLTEQEIRRLVEMNAPWTMLFFPSSNYLKGFDTKVNLLETFNDWSGIALNRLDLSGLNKQTEINSWMTMVSDDGMTNYCAFTRTSVNVIRNQYYIKFTNKFAEYINRESPQKIRINSYADLNLLGYYWYGKNRRFQVPLNENPIPINNMIVWNYDEATDTYRFNHTAEITMYFPNVYVISNVPEDTNIVVAIYYYKTNHTEFKNPIELYMKYDINYMNNVIDGSLPWALKEYIPKRIIYSEKDYWNSREFPNSQQYILDKLIYLLVNDSSKYRDLYKTITANYRYKIRRHIISLQDIQNILERKCMNNRSQISRTVYHEDFDEPCTYIQITHSEDKLYPQTIWINGRHWESKYRYMENLIEYLYIPTRLLDPETLIEIEVYEFGHQENGLEISTEVYFETTDSRFTFPEKFDLISDQNVIFYNRDTMEILKNVGFSWNYEEVITKYYLLDSLQRYLLTKWGENIITSQYNSFQSVRDGFFKYVPYDMVTLRANLQENCAINIICQKVDYYKKVVVPAQETPIELFEFQDFKLDPSANRIRIFKSGKMLYPDTEFKVKQQEIFGISPTITFISPIINEEIIVEYLPYRYLFRGYLKNVNEQNIDIGNFIDRVYDSSYYDIVVDGIKVNPDAIQTITNTKIHLNIELNNSFIGIFEVAHDEDVYGNDYERYSLMDRVMREDTNFRKWVYKYYNGQL